MARRANRELEREGGERAIELHPFLTTPNLNAARMGREREKLGGKREHGTCFLGTRPILIRIGALKGGWNCAHIRNKGMGERAHSEQGEAK